MIIGLILIIIGAVFLLQNLGYISEGAWSIIWPAILIVIGLAVILKRRNHGFFLARQNFYWPFWCPKEKEKSQKRENDSE